MRSTALGLRYSSAISGIGVASGPGAVLDIVRARHSTPAASFRRSPGPPTMKIRNSLKSAKRRDKYCRVVLAAPWARFYVINKKNPRA